MTPVIWGDLHCKTVLLSCCWNISCVFCAQSSRGGSSWSDRLPVCPARPRGRPDGHRCCRYSRRPCSANLANIEVLLASRGHSSPGKTCEACVSLMLLQVLILYTSLPKTTTSSAAGSSFRYGVKTSAAISGRSQSSGTSLCSFVGDGFIDPNPSILSCHN